MSDNEFYRALRERLDSRSATVGVIGLGYVGLPLAAAMAEVGFNVVGIDLDVRRVDTINAGLSHVEDVESGDVRKLVRSGRLRAAVDFKALRGADAAIIAVPTPIDEYRVPDLSYVESAAKALADVLGKGSLVVLESTTYPGTTEEVVIPAFVARGFSPGSDVFIGYSPERIDPGNTHWGIRNTPKIASGLTAECLDLLTALYGSFVESVVPVGNLRTAEVTKLFENIFRIVNIALVNEFNQICDAFGIDVWEVIRACSTKPYGFMPFFPGPGLGGHCVPVDPFYLAWKARERNVNTEFIELAGRVNAAMPKYVVGRVAKVLNAARKPVNGARIGLLGVAYKKNTSDTRESPAIRLIELLAEEHAEVSYHDPHVPTITVSGVDYASNPNLADFLSGLDCAVVVADHDAIDWDAVVQYAPMVVDTRNVLGRIAPQAPASRFLQTTVES